MKYFVLTFVASWAVVLSLSGCSPKHETKPVAATEPTHGRVHFLQATRNTPVFDDVTVDEYALLNQRMRELLARVGFNECEGYLVPMHFGPTVVVQLPWQRSALPENELKAFTYQFFAECEKELVEERAIREKRKQLSRE